MPTVCQIKRVVNRGIDRVEAALADATATLHTWTDELAARTGRPLPPELNLKYAIDSTNGKYNYIYEQDKDNIISPLVRRIEEAAQAANMKGSDFQNGVSQYIRMHGIIERAKKSIWYNRKNLNKVVTLRPKSLTSYQLGSMDFRYGYDVIREIKHQLRDLYGKFYQLSPQERDDRVELIQRLRDMLFDPANEAVLLKPDWKEGASYEGVDIATAEEILAEMDPQYGNFYEANTDVFDTLRNTLNTRREQSGRVGEAGILERELYGWKYYVPFKGTSSEQDVEKFLDDFDIFRSTGYLNSPLDEKMRGRTTQAADPLTQLVLDLYRSGQTLVDAEVERTIMRIAVEYGEESGIQISDPYDVTGIKYLRAGIKPKKGRTIARKPNTILVHQGDTLRRLTITDRNLFEGIKSHWNRSNGAFNNIYKWTMRPIAALKTKYNLPWVIYTNFIREFRQQLIFGAIELSADSSGKFSFDLSSKYIKNVLAFKGFASAVRYSVRDSLGKQQLEAQGSDYAKWANLYARMGGESTFYQALKLGTVRENLENMYAATFATNERPASKLKAAASKAMDFYDGVVDGIDLSTRVALFKAIVESGKKDPAEAAIYVKNIMNFNYKGRYGDLLKSMFMFFGPSSAGVFRMLRTMTRGNVAQKWALMAWYTAGTGFTYMLANMFAGEDDDGEDKLKKVDSYTAIKNSVIPVADNDGMFSLVPRSIGLETIIAAPGILAARVMLGHTTESEAATTLTRTVIDNASFLMPGDAGDAPTPITTLSSVLATVTPSQIRPLYEVATNQSSMGLPIWNPFATDDTPQFMQSKDSTDEIYVELSRKLYGGVGVDIAPESVKYATLQYFGIIGSTINRIATLHEKQVRGDPIASTDIPFAPTMSTKDPIYYPQRQFTKVRNQWKIASKDYEFALEEGESPDPTDALGWSFERQVKKYDNRISASMRQIRESDLPEDEKIRQLKGLRDARQAIRDQLVREWLQQTGE